MSTRYEVAWQYQRSVDTHAEGFRHEDRAEDFYARLQTLGGLNWLSLREIQNHELRRWEAAEQV